MTSRPWTVTTWNLQGAKPTDLSAVARHLEDMAPDVAVLQEVRPPQAEQLAELLGMHHHWSFKHHAFTPLFDRWAEGAAILTPHRLQAPSHAVISTSTSRRTYRRRIAQWARVERGDDAIRVFNLHLSPHELREERLHETAEITRLATAATVSEPLVVAGDLNDHGEAAVIDALPGVEHVAAPPTNPSEAPVAVLDHVLLPEDATSVTSSAPDGGAEWAALSDHVPLTVSFVL